MRENKNSLVSVVIPTYNEEKDIGECLNSLLVQSYKNVEVIVVDDDSNDGTTEIVKRFTSVRMIKGKHRGPGFSRNLGSKKAKGKILVFVDADMSFPKDYIENLTEMIRRGECIGTEEKQQFASNLNNVWSKCWGSYSKENRGNLGHIFRAILKKEFVSRGGFDSKYGYADDMTLYFKYGLKSNIADKAFCYHKNPETLKDVFKQSRWIGASLPVKWKLFSMPFFGHVACILLFPLSIIFIPLITLYKAFVKKQFNLIGYLFVFYTVRYFGTLNGLCRKVFKNVNTR